MEGKITPNLGEVVGLSDKESKIINSRERLNIFFNGINYLEKEGDLGSRKTRTILPEELQSIEEDVKILVHNLDFENYTENILRDLKRIVDFQYFYGKKQIHADIEELGKKVIADNLSKIKDLLDGDDIIQIQDAFRLVVNSMDSSDDNTRAKANTFLRDNINIIKRIIETDRMEFDDGIVVEIAKSGFDDLATALEETLIKAYSGTGDSFFRSGTIAELIISDNEKARDMGIRLASQLLSSDYGLDGERIVRLWLDNYGDWSGSRRHSIIGNIKTIDRLESLYRGISKYLNEEFGIVNFSRYPQKLLLNQYLERDNTDLPYGVILYPMTDHNAAFNEAGELSEFLDSLEGSYSLRVYEISSKRELTESLIKANKKYGKIDFGIIGGHGSENSISIGRSWKSGTIYAVDILLDYDSEVQGLKDEPRSSSQRLIKKYFIENPIIVLVSCSTGKGEKGGIANLISRLGATVLAPDNKGSFIELTAFRTTKNEFKIQPLYAGANTRVFKEGKEITEEYFEF